MLPSSRTLLVLLVASVVLDLAAPVAQSSDLDQISAQIAKTCKKKHPGTKKERRKCKKTVTPQTVTPQTVTPQTVTPPAMTCANDGSEPNDSINQATPLTFQTSEYFIEAGGRFFLCPSDRDVFRFTVAFSMAFYVCVDTPDSNLAPLARLYDYKGELLSWNWDSDTYGGTPPHQFCGQFWVAQPTTLYAEVSGRSAETSAGYTLSIAAFTYQGPF